MQEDVHVVGLSILSGSHMELVPEVVRGLREAGLDDVPVVVGGIIPESDARELKALGVAAVFTPKDYTINEIMVRIVDEIRRAHRLPVPRSDREVLRLPDNCGDSTASGTVVSRTNNDSTRRTP